MSLFDIKNVVAPQIIQQAVKAAESVVSATLHGDVVVINERAGKMVGAVMESLAPGKHTVFFTSAVWTMPDVLEYILAQTGRADVYIATWAMKELPARKLMMMKEMGKIGKLHLKLDHRVKTYNSDVYAFLQLNADKVQLANCHAKVTVVLNEQWGVLIVGSANYSANPRAEAGVLICDREAAVKAADWVLNFNDKNKPDGMD